LDTLFERLRKKVIIFLFLSLSSSCNLTNDRIEYPDCTLSTINQEIEKLSTSDLVLDTIFHLSEEQIQQYYAKKNTHLQRESVLLKFALYLSDSSKIESCCNPTKHLDLRVGDLAFYCLAKTEPFPFASATGRQNCTGRYVSSEVRIPVDFIYYTSFKRKELSDHFLQYLDSEDRKNYLKCRGLD